MKKIILLTVLSFVALFSSAQVEPGFRTGIRANVGMSKVTECEAVLKVSYGLGWAAEYNFSEVFYINSGIDFNMLGMKDYDGGRVEGTLNALYAQLPLEAGFRFGLGDSSSFFVQAGPIFRVGIVGSDINWYGHGSSSYFDDAKRIGLGLGGRLGIELNGFQISAGADYGMLNVFYGGGHNLDFNLGIAYMF